MKTKRLLALAMAGAMMTGAFATAMPVLADENNTTMVSFTVAPKNTYTMKVPANTSLNPDGSATALTDGITVSSNNDIALNYAVVVTASSANNWKLKNNDGKETEISYGLYSDEDCSNNIIVEYNYKTYWSTSIADSLVPKPYKFADDDNPTKVEKGMWFMSDEVNGANGITRQVYAKVDTTESDTWASGTYSDIITFTADVNETINFTITDKDTNVVHKYTVLNGTRLSNLSRTDKVDGQLYTSQVYRASKSEYWSLRKDGYDWYNPNYQFKDGEEYNVGG